MKVCVFTGTRADYGLLRPVMARIARSPELTLQILASGSHLSSRHGSTADAIAQDGFTIDAAVPIPLQDDSATGVAAATGLTIQGCAEALGNLRPDMLVVLGDRYEGLAACVAGTLMRVPIAHVHGGESTEGAMDEMFRHAMTKMAHLHFTSCEPYRRRVIQLGEAPERVFNVGALGVENARTIPLLDKREFEEQLGFSLGGSCLLATYHPETLDQTGEQSVAQVFEGFDTVLETMPQVRMILTGANADPGGVGIDAKARAFQERWAARVFVIPSLGQVRYLSAMVHCAAVVGNSSSGIIEAPSFGIPTVNIGDRQKGRIRAASILDAPNRARPIVEAIANALGPHAQVAKRAVNPYESPGTSEKILQAIKAYPGGVIKTFHDIPFIEGQPK